MTEAQSPLTEYLVKAEDADEEAEKTKEPAAKAAWRTIAAGYRDLARVKRRWT